MTRPSNSNTSLPDKNVAFIWIARALFYFAIIAGCTLAFLPSGNTLHANLNDKLAHSACFFILSFLFHVAHRKIKVWQYLLALALLGIFIELVQATIPSRSFEWLDWAADILGVVAYFVFAYTLTQRFILNNIFGPD